MSRDQLCLARFPRSLEMLVAEREASRVLASQAFIPRQLAAVPGVQSRTPIVRREAWWGSSTLCSRWISTESAYGRGGVCPLSEIFSEVTAAQARTTPTPWRTAISPPASPLQMHASCRGVASLAARQDASLLLLHAAVLLVVPLSRGLLPQRAALLGHLEFLVHCGLGTLHLRHIWRCLVRLGHTPLSAQRELSTPLPCSASRQPLLT